MKMPSTLVVLSSIITSFSAVAQTNSTTTLVCYFEKAPEFAMGGGQTAIMAAIRKNLVYPPSAVRARVEGRVFIRFTITSAGLVQNACVIKGLRPDCDTAAVQAVRKLPRFKPCEQLGKPITCGYTVPIRFKLPVSRRLTR